MRTLARAARRKTHAGQPLENVFQALAQLGVRPRRGEVTLIAAESKSAKTFLGMYWAAAVHLPGLYFSADSDDRTMTERAAAMVTGDTQDEVRKHLDPVPAPKYADALASLDLLRWVFESDPTYVDLEEETAAYTEAYGDFPQVLVVDNLTNVAGEQEDEYRSMRDTTRALHRLARITQAAIFVLHHVREDGPQSENHPPPKSRLKGKVADFPELVLTLRLDGDLMQIAPVANRHGTSDRSGRTFAEVYVDLDRARFYNSRAAMQMDMPA